MLPVPFHIHLFFCDFEFIIQSHHMVLSSYNISYKRFQQKDAYDGYEILKDICPIQNYFNGTILTADVNLNATFHKPTTVQTCLPHLDHENIALSASNITTLFFYTTAI